VDEFEISFHPPECNELEWLGSNIDGSLSLCPSLRQLG
jgi:hypothetical protein